MAARPGAGHYPGVEAAAQALDARVASVGMWLFLSANTFYYAAWYFAFFYLKALNNNNAWIVQGLTRPNRAYGTIVLVLVLLSAGAFVVADRGAAVRSLAWRLPATAALVLGLGAVLLQGYEMWHLGFGLTQGGYPSVFAGLTGSWTVELAAATFWLATILTQARAGGDTVVRRAAVSPFVNLLGFVAVVAIVNWIVLYFLA